MSTTINGSDLVLLIEVGGSLTPVAHATSHSLDVEVGTRDVSSKASGKWTESEATRMSFSGSSDGLVSYSDSVGYHKLFELMTSRQPIEIASVLTEDGESPLAGSKMYKGEVILTSLNKSAPDNDNATYSISFTGTGPLSPIDVIPSST